MSKRLFTQEQFNEAAAALVAEGNVPTVRNMRKKLGGSSDTTIVSMLQAWSNDSGGGVVTVSAMPAEVKSKTDELGAVAWAAAKRQANHELGAVRQQMETERGKLKIQLDDAYRDLIEIEQERDQLRRSLEDETAARQEECRRRFEAEERAIRLRRRNAELEPQVDALQLTITQCAVDAARSEVVVRALQQELSDLKRQLALSKAPRQCRSTGPKANSKSSPTQGAS
jgi:chromosome segregation ATPase